MRINGVFEDNDVGRFIYFGCFHYIIRHLVSSVECEVYLSRNMFYRIWLFFHLRYRHIEHYFRYGGGYLSYGKS